MTIGLGRRSKSIRGLTLLLEERGTRLIYKCRLRAIPNSQLGHRIENIQLRRAPTVVDRDGRAEGRKEGEGLKCCQSVWQNRGRTENRIPELLTPRRRETTHGIAAEGKRYTGPRKVI